MKKMYIQVEYGDKVYKSGYYGEDDDYNNHETAKKASNGEFDSLKLPNDDTVHYIPKYILERSIISIVYVNEDEKVEKVEKADKNGIVIGKTYRISHSCYSNNKHRAGWIVTIVPDNRREFGEDVYLARRKGIESDIAFYVHKDELLNA